MISREDVIDVATRLKMTLTDKQIDWVVKQFPEWEPGFYTDLWSEIVETMLYSKDIENL